jgi:hypothetical protein
MKQTLLKNSIDVTVCERIIDDLSVLAVVDKLGLLKDPKLMRYGGLGHPQKHGDIADAHLRVEQGAYDFYARRISEHFKQLREIQQLVFIGHAIANLVHDILVNGVTVASVDIRGVSAHHSHPQQFVD